MEKFQIGKYAKVAPEITGYNYWIEGKIIDVEDNPFRGLVIAIKDKTNCIFFGDAKYFQTIENL
jgi:hypothetical protein